MSKIKLQIKNRFTGSILFEYESENNTIKETVVNAVKSGADLRGADLGKGKVKTFAVFTGIYQYTAIPCILETGECRVKMGCHDRSVAEWDADFWNNNDEFPNNGSVKSNLRVIAYDTAKKWIELNKNL